MRFLPLLLLAAATASAAPAPEEFTLRVPLETQGSATWYRFELPLNIQLQAQEADLRDLRIFNGAGEPVPYSLTAATATRQDAERQSGLRRFPLYAATNDPIAAPGLRIKTGADGTLIEIDPNQPPPHGQTLRGWLLDASGVADPLERLELEWSDGPEGFQQFRVETSDDLQRWSYCCDGRLARIAFGDERIEQRSVSLGERQARYLRLLWTEPATAPQLTAVTAFSAHRETAPPPVTWSSPLLGAPGKEGEWLWTLPLALPLERLRLENLPDSTLAPLRVQGRRADNLPWNPMGQGLIYRLRVQDRTMEQLELTLPRTPVRRLKLIADARGGGLGSSPPALSVGLTANRITFLARGNPPFTLALGHAGLEPASLPADTLVPAGLGRDAIGSAQLALSESQQTATPAGPAPATAYTPDWKRIALWAVLLAGVALLGAMVWQLIGKAKSS